MHTLEGIDEPIWCLYMNTQGMLIHDGEGRAYCDCCIMQAFNANENDSVNARLKSEFEKYHRVHSKISLNEQRKVKSEAVRYSQEGFDVELKCFRKNKDGYFVCEKGICKCSVCNMSTSDNRFEKSHKFPFGMTLKENKEITCYNDKTSLFPKKEDSKGIKTKIVIDSDSKERCAHCGVRKGTPRYEQLHEAINRSQSGETVRVYCKVKDEDASLEVQEETGRIYCSACEMKLYDPNSGVSLQVRFEQFHDFSISIREASDDNEKYDIIKRLRKPVPQQKGHVHTPKKGKKSYDRNKEKKVSLDETTFTTEEIRELIHDHAKLDDILQFALNSRPTSFFKEDVRIAKIVIEDKNEYYDRLRIILGDHGYIEKYINSEKMINRKQEKQMRNIREEVKKLFREQDELAKYKSAKETPSDPEGAAEDLLKLITQLVPLVEKALEKGGLFYAEQLFEDFKSDLNEKFKKVRFPESSKLSSIMSDVEAAAADIATKEKEKEE